MTKKRKKQTGRVQTDIPHPENYPEIPAVLWDDWSDSRDGLRVNFDRKHIRSVHMCYLDDERVAQLVQENNKLRKLNRRRKIQQIKQKLKG